jgi:hypothetical protein
MFALAAVILFVVALVKLDSASVWQFWALLGLLALSVHSVWDYLPVPGRRPPAPPA